MTMSRSESKTIKNHSKFQYTTKDRISNNSKNLKNKTPYKLKCRKQEVQNVTHKQKPCGLNGRTSLKQTNFSQKSQTSATLECNTSEKFALIKKGGYCKIITSQPSTADSNNHEHVSSSTKSSKLIKKRSPAAAKISASSSLHEYERDSQKNIELYNEVEQDYLEELKQDSQEEYLDQDAQKAEEIQDEEENKLQSLKIEIVSDETAEFQEIEGQFDEMSISEDESEDEITEEIIKGLHYEQSYEQIDISLDRISAEGEIEVTYEESEEQETPKKTKRDICATVTAPDKGSKQSHIPCLIMNDRLCKSRKPCISEVKHKRRIIDREELRTCVEITSLINQRIMDYKSGLVSKTKIQTDCNSRSYYSESLQRKMRQYRKHVNHICNCSKSQTFTKFESISTSRISDSQMPCCTCCKCSKPKKTSKDSQFPQRPHTVCESSIPKPCYMCITSKRLGSCVRYYDNQFHQKTIKENFPCQEEQLKSEKKSQLRSTSVSDTCACKGTVCKTIQSECVTRTPCKPIPSCPSISCCEPDQSSTQVQQQCEYDEFKADQIRTSLENDEILDSKVSSEILPTTESEMLEDEDDRVISGSLVGSVISGETSEILLAEHEDIKEIYEHVDDEMIVTEEMQKLYDTEIISDESTEKTRSEETDFEETNLEETYLEETSSKEDKLLSEPVKSDSEVLIKSEILSQRDTRSIETEHRRLSLSTTPREKVCQEIINDSFENSNDDESYIKPCMELDKRGELTPRQAECMRVCMRKAPKRPRCDQLPDLDVDRTVLAKHPDGFCVVVNIDKSKPGEKKLLTETTLNEIKYSRNVRGLKDRRSQQMIRKSKAPPSPAVCNPNIVCPDIEKDKNCTEIKKEPSSQTSLIRKSSSIYEATSDQMVSHEEIKSIVNVLERISEIDENIIEELEHSSAEELLNDLDVLQEEHLDSLQEEQFDSLQEEHFEKVQSKDTSLSSIKRKESSTFSEQSSSPKQSVVESAENIEYKQFMEEPMTNQISIEQEHTEEKMDSTPPVSLESFDYSLEKTPSQPKRVSYTVSENVTETSAKRSCPQRPFLHV